MLFVDNTCILFCITNGSQLAAIIFFIATVQMFYHVGPFGSLSIVAFIDVY